MKTPVFVTSILVAIAVTACAYSSRRLSPDVDSVKVGCVDSIVNTPQKYLGKKVTVKGIIGAVSSKEDRRLFLEGSNDSTFIRCDATCNIGGAFPKMKAGGKVEITGLVQELKVDETTLSRFESIFLSKMQELGTAASSVDDPDTLMLQKAIDAGFPGFALGGKSDTLFHETLDIIRAQIAERCKNEGKKYISYYYIDVTKCQLID